MPAEKEVLTFAQSVYLDPDLFHAFKQKALGDRKGVNQALNDLLAETVGMPKRRIVTSRPIKPKKPRRLARSA